MDKEKQKRYAKEILELISEWDYDDVDASIQDIIYELTKIRKDKKISQAELSEMSGIAQSTISRIETHRVIPTLPILFKILHSLDCKLTIILQ